MSRPQASDEAVGCCLLIEMGHPEGTIYAATSLVPVEWNGNLFHGLGLVGSIEGLEESAKVEVPEVSFTLAGVTDDQIAGLSSSVKGYQATVWHTLLDEAGRVVEEPEVITVVDLDTQDYEYGAGGETKIIVRGFSAIMDIRKSPDTYYTPEFQRERHPDDTGLDRIPKLVDRVASWRPS